LALALLLLAGCSRDVPVSTVLEETGGLRAGDKVYLDGREVGSIDSIETAGQTPGVAIDISLYPEHAVLVQEDAVAYVPLESPPMLRLVNPAKTAPPVAPGGRLKGLSALELTIWQVSDAAGQASSLMEALALRIDDYFESEEWRQARAQLDTEMSELAASSKATAERVAEELAQLIESLTEAAADRADEVGEEITRIKKEIRRLEAEGHEELAESLRRLLERVEEMAQPEPEPQEIEA
jgi:ABC-type transporter Mla subunit MlaD